MMWFLITWAWCNNSTNEELCDFLVVYLMLMLSLYFLILLPNPAQCQGLSRVLTTFFVGRTGGGIVIDGEGMRREEGFQSVSC